MLSVLSCCNLSSANFVNLDQYKTFIPPLQRRGRVFYFSYVRPSVHTNVFHHTFLSNHASQPHQTWYGALARGPTRRLPNSGQPVIYFLVPCLVHFWTLHLGIARVYSVSERSQISCCIW